MAKKEEGRGKKEDGEDGEEREEREEREEGRKKRPQFLIPIPNL